jgi:hypothetical protein
VPAIFVVSRVVMARALTTFAVGALGAAALAMAGTTADAGAWCATYRRGVENCGYSSYEQCRATASGLGGSCRPNPFPNSAFGSAAGSWNSSNTQRRYRRD